MFSLAVYEAQDVGIPLLQSIQLLNLHWDEPSNKLFTITAVKDVVFPLSLVHCISFVSMIRRLSQQHIVVQWRIFKEKGQAWNWMSYYRKFKDFIGKMQTNKLPVWHSSALPKTGGLIKKRFDHHFSSLNVQPVDFNLIFFYQNTSVKVCSCVYSIDRQGRSWWQNIEAVHPRTYDALVMTVQHKFLRDPWTIIEREGLINCAYPRILLVQADRDLTLFYLKPRQQESLR